LLIGYEFIVLAGIANLKLKKETVAEYVTSGMERKIKHKINGKNKDLL